MKKMFQTCNKNYQKYNKNDKKGPKRTKNYKKDKTDQQQSKTAQNRPKQVAGSGGQNRRSGRVGSGRAGSGRKREFVTDPLPKRAQEKYAVQGNPSLRYICILYIYIQGHFE